MTGFGRSVYEIDGRTYTVEIKSVNHKYNDINIIQQNNAKIKNREQAVIIH